MTSPPGSPAREVVLIANLGDRDLFRDGERITPPREEGQRILDDYASQRARLSLPLLDPVLGYLKRGRGRIDRLILYATDQGESAPNRHRSSDTLYFAEAAKRLLEDQGYRGKVTVRLFRNRNPSLYDETYPFYLAELGRKGVFDNAESVYVMATGGTPAMSLGLLVAAVERFGNRCVPLYLQDGASEPRRLGLVEQLRQATLRQVAASHLKRYQFAAVEAELRQGDFDEADCRLAAYAATRLNFDWHGAWRIADESLTHAHGELGQLWEDLRAQARMLDEEADRPLFLGERYHQARVAYETGAYSEFLALLVGLEEAVLRALVREHLAIDFRGDDYSARRERERQLAERTGLRQYLEALDADRGLRDYVQSNRFSMRAILGYLTGPGREDPGIMATDEKRASVTEALAIEKRLSDRLGGLRNRAVHENGGASREMIEDLYSSHGKAPADLLEDLERLTRLAGGVVDDWGIERVRKALQCALGE